jgi:endonuclease YncB( thermonuclease family)
MTNPSLDRRRFLIGSAFVTVAPLTSFSDGQSITLGDHEYVLTDIVAPSLTPLSGAQEPDADFARAVLREVMMRGRPISDSVAATDRWGRIRGAIRWKITGGRETTLQEILVAQGAARVAPQSEDFAFIDRCYATEGLARKNSIGMWRRDAYRIFDANKPETADGFQIYEGEIRSAGEHGARVYFNFGDNYRDDFTASVSRATFRRWKQKTDPAATVGKRAEVRGFVARINGPSIELLHEKQLRIL